MPNQTTCNSKAIATTADYLSRSAKVKAVMPIVARDIGAKYGFTFDPLTDARRTTYDEIYRNECVIALLQFLGGADVTPGTDPTPQPQPTPTVTTLASVRAFAPASIYVGDYTLIAATTVGGSSKTTLTWDTQGLPKTGLNRNLSVIGIRFQEIGTYTITVTATDGDTSVTDTETINVVALPTSGDNPTPTPTAPIYDTGIQSADIVIVAPSPVYTVMQHDFGAYLNGKTVESPAWAWAFTNSFTNDSSIPASAWQAGQVVNTSFAKGDVGGKFATVRVQYGPADARQTAYATIPLSAQDVPTGPTGPAYDTTINPMDITVPIPGTLYVDIEYQFAAFLETKRAENPNWWFTFDPKDGNNQPIESGDLIDRRAWQAGQVEDHTFKDDEDGPHWIWVKLEYGASNARQVVFDKFGISVKKLPGSDQSVSGKPLAAADMAFYAYPPEFNTSEVTEFGLNSKPFPVTIGTRVPLMVRTRLGKTFPPNTRFEFSTDIKYGAWTPTTPTIGVPAQICDLTGADGDTTKPVTSQPGAYHAYAVVRQPGADDITLTIPLDLQAAAAPTAPAGTPVDANSMRLAVYPPNIKEPGEIVSYATSGKPMPIKPGTRVPVMVATLGEFPQGTTFTFGTTLILEGRVPHFVPIHIPIYLMDLSKEDGSQAGTQQITVKITQPGAADITLSRDVFYQTVDPPAPPDANPVSPWEIDLKAQGLRGGIVDMNRLEPGMTYYLLPEITGRNVRGVLKIAMGLDSQLYDATKEPASPAATFVWLDGDPKDTSRHHFYVDNVSQEQSPEDFNPRNPDADDKQAASLLTDGQGRGPNDRFMYFALFYPQDENGKYVGDPVARGFYPQSVETGNIIAGLPGEPDQSAAITLSGQPPQGFVMDTEYTLTAGVKQGYMVAGNFAYMWVIGEPYDTAPPPDQREWRAADSNGRFVIKFDQSMIVDPSNPNYKNQKFKLWLKLVIHRKDGHDSQTISNPFILLANPG